MKKLLIPLLTAATILLTSCGGGDDDYKTPDESASEMITNIVICFENGDKETLKSYFSESARKYKEIDAEIDEAFEFIDGKIVSYGEPIPGCIGPIEDKAYGGTIETIMTDKGIEYKIDFDGMYRCDEHKTQEGVTGIRIVNMTENSQLSPNATDKERDECHRYIGEYE